MASLYYNYFRINEIEQEILRIETDSEEEFNKIDSDFQYAFDYIQNLIINGSIKLSVPITTIQRIYPTTIADTADEDLEKTPGDVTEYTIESGGDERMLQEEKAGDNEHLYLGVGGDEAGLVVEPLPEEQKTGDNDIDLEKTSGDVTEYTIESDEEMPQEEKAGDNDIQLCLKVGADEARLVEEALPKVGTAGDNDKPFDLEVHDGGDKPGLVEEQCEMESDFEFSDYDTKIQRECDNVYMKIDKFNILHPITDDEGKKRGPVKQVKMRKKQKGAKGWKASPEPQTPKQKRAKVMKPRKLKKNIVKETPPQQQEDAYESIVNLLEIIKEKRPLWDFKTNLQKNRGPAAVKKLWVEVSKECTGFKTSEEARVKFANLRRQYNRAKSDLKMASGSSSTPCHKWKFFDEMRFLDDVGENVLTETNIEAEEVIAEPESKDEEEYDLPVPSKIRNGKRTSAISVREEQVMEAELEVLNIWKTQSLSKRDQTKPQDAIDSFCKALGDILRCLDDDDNIKLQAFFMQEAYKQRMIKKV